MKVKMKVTILYLVTTCLADGPVNFPGLSISGRLSARSGIQVSDCPGGESFCDQVSDYPNDLQVTNLLENKKLVADKIFSATFPSIDTRKTFGEKRACTGFKRTITPQKAKNIDGDFVFIVNHGSYKQSVEIEQCRSEGSSCRTESDTPFFGSTKCKQKYSTHKMYAFNRNKEQIYDSFSLPSACICHHNSGISTRRGAKPKKKSSRQLPFCTKPEPLALDQQLPQQSQQQNQQQLPQQNQQQNQQQFKQQNQQQNQQQFTQQNQQQNNNQQTQSRNRDFSQPSFPQFSQSSDTRFQSSQQRDRTVFFLSRNKSKRRTARNRESQGWRWKREVSRSRRQGRGRRVSGCPGGSLFCSVSRSEYPSRLMKKRLDVSGVSGELFNQVFNGECKNDLSLRTFSIDEEQLCFGVQQVVFPRKAKNLNNQWRFVVNVDNYTQSVEVEECQNASVDSTEYNDCLYSGSTGNNPDITNCKQVYSEHKLLALTEQGQLEVDNFMLPSACACFVNEDGDFNLYL